MPFFVCRLIAPRPTFAFDMKGVSKRSAFVLDKNGVVRYAEVLEKATDLPDFTAIQKTLTELN